MGSTYATMLTMTTYGTWLRGDVRGWIDDGRVMPPNPQLEDDDRRRMKHPVFTFGPADLVDVGSYIGESLIERLQVRIFALTVQTWHAHIVIGPTRVDLARIVKCAKDAVRWGLRPGRPIWTDGYDRRFCFDERAMWNRVEYVERHNIALGLPARPWPFIKHPDSPG
jgi:hypothetical protein